MRINTNYEDFKYNFLVFMRRNLSVEELSEAYQNWYQEFGITRQTFSKYLNLRKNNKLDVPAWFLLAISEKLNVEPAKLFNYSYHQNNTITKTQLVA